MTQSVSSKSIQSLAASKVTGALPAVDGSALTGISAGVYNNASDPTITSNRALGTLWANSVSGNLFCCTDATSNNNVWVNVGAGAGPVGKCFGGIGGGTVKGWQMGAAQAGTTNVIQSYSFTANGNATDVADLSNSTTQGTGNSSTTHGYKTGHPANVIDKFAFVSTSNASNVGSLPVARGAGACSVGSKTNGYITGGHSASDRSTQISKMVYASDGVATDVGHLTAKMYHQGGGASATHGYNGGGQDYPATFFKIVQKFSFAAEDDCVTVGELSNGFLGYCTGQSSDTAYYTTMGYLTAPANNSSNNIEKNLFASDSNSVDVGSLTVSRSKGSSSSSTTHGYNANGTHKPAASGTTVNTIDKFSFANESTTADVGDMISSVSAGAGAQF